MASIKFILITFFVASTTLLILDYATANPAEDAKVRLFF